MTQPFLHIALGALATALLVLFLLPAYRRRVEKATRLSLEGQMPMTADAIQAGRDALRAEFAVARQRLEQEAQAARDSESGLKVSAARGQEEARQAAAERDRLAAGAERLEGEAETLRTALEAARAESEERGRQLAERDRQAIERTAELKRIGAELEETTYLASSRQIELVGREAELERLQEELEAAQRTVAGLEARLTEARSAAEERERRSADAVARAESLTSEVFETESRVERSRSDAERLKRELAAAQAEREAAAQELLEARKERMGLELEFAALNRQLATLFPGTVPGGDPATGLRAAAAERDRIEARLAQLGRENRELRRTLDQAPGEAETGLREEMLRLAAEVTVMVARLEGPGGAVDRALAGDGPREEGQPPSLADRVAALRGRS